MQFNQINLMNLTGERATGLYEALAHALGDSRPLPEGPARLGAVFSRLAQYQAENADLEVQPPEGGEVGRRETASGGVGESGQRSNPPTVDTPSGGNRSSHRGLQGSGVDQNNVLEGLARRCCDKFVQELTPELAEFWRSLTTVEQRRYSTYIFDKILNEDLEMYSEEDIVEYYVNEALESLKKERLRRSEKHLQSRLEQLDASEQSIFPQGWLMSAVRRAKELGMSDFDLQKPLPELTASQKAILEDKQFVEACQAFNMQSLLSGQKDREHDKELRQRLEAWQRALIQFELVVKAFEQPDLVSIEMLSRFIDAFRASMLIESQKVARQRVIKALDPNVAKRLADPPSHVAKSEIAAEWTSALKLKSTEQLFAAQRDRRDAKADDDDDELDRSKRSRVDSSLSRERGSRGGSRGGARGGRGRGRGGSRGSATAMATSAGRGAARGAASTAKGGGDSGTRTTAATAAGGGSSGNRPNS